MAEFPCIECYQECNTDTLERSNCKNLLHTGYVQMSPSAFRVWLVDGKTCLRKNCCFNGNTYDAESGLRR